MKQALYGSGAVLIGVGEVATRLRESTHTMVKALAVMKQQGRAAETHVRGRCRLHLSVMRSRNPATRCVKPPPHATRPIRKSAGKRSKHPVSQPMAGHLHLCGITNFP
jgi:hypothetical protein